MAVSTEELARLKAHRWQVSCLEFRQDGSWLASGGWDKEVHIWDLNNLEVYCTLKGAHKVPITNLSWQRPAGHLLCTSSADHTAVLWNVETARQVKTLTQHSGWVLGSCFSSTGSALATASWDGTVAIWDPETGEHINSYSDHTKGVWAVDFHPNSSTVLCSGSEDGTVKMWDLRDGKVIRTLSSSHSDAVHCAKWSPDGTMIASGSDTKVCIWDVNTGQLTNTVYGHTDTVKSLAFNPSTNTVLPILASAGDYTILLSDPRPTQKSEILTLSPHTLGKEVEAVGISPDGSLLISGGRDGLLVFMNLSVPSLRPHLLRENSISTKIRHSISILDQSVETNSTEDQAEAISQASTSDLSVGASRESIPLDGGLQERPQDKVVPHSARISRKRRTEKKVVDLPTMIAHLSASVRTSMLEEQLSSSDSEDDMEKESHKKISSLVHVAQKVDKFSQFARKTSVQEMLHKAPEPKRSLLPANVPETIKEKKKYFETRKTTKVEDTDGAEYYDGYSSLLPGEPDESDSDEEAGEYAMKLEGSAREDITALIDSRQHSFTDELGSGDDYDDIVSMI